MGRGRLPNQCSRYVDLKYNKDAITPPLIRGYFLLTRNNNSIT